MLGIYFLTKVSQIFDNIWAIFKNVTYEVPKVLFRQLLGKIWSLFTPTSGRTGTDTHLVSDLKNQLNLVFEEHFEGRDKELFLKQTN